MKIVNCVKRAWAIALILFVAGIMPGMASIRLTVDVPDKTRSMVVVVYQTTIVEIPLDENGHGSHLFENLPAVHANLYYGMDSKKFFMEDGDDIYVSFPGNNFKDQISFTVKNRPGKEKIFEYLNKTSILAPSDKDFALPFEEYVELIEKKEKASKKILKTWKLGKVSPLFEKIENARIHYALAQMFFMYPVGHVMMTGDTTYRPDSDYYKVIASCVKEDRKILGLKEYREVMKEAAYVLSTKGDKISDLYQKTLCEMEYFIDNLKDETVLQTLLTVLAIEQVEQYGIKGIDEMLTLYNTYVTDSLLRASFQEKYDVWDIIKPGKPSPDFIALDPSGKSYRLTDFRGKYLYIDLWATWCGPCRREIPYLQRLEKEYEGKNITFLSLSTDASKTDWTEFLQSHEMGGVQLYIGAASKFQQLYNADGIPHFILLDTEGRIVEGNMLRPSSPDIRPYFDRLPGISGK